MRYIVFAMEFYEVQGGFGDFVDGFAREADAIACAEAEFARLHHDGKPVGDVHVADLMAKPAHRLIWINGVRVREVERV